MATWYYIKEQQVVDIEGVLKPRAAEVVFHIDIPTGTNSANRTWRDCVLDRVDLEGNGVVSSIRNLASRFSAQNSKLQSGAAYEINETVTFSSISLTPAQRNAAVQARADEIEATLLSRLQIEMEFTGYNNTV